MGQLNDLIREAKRATIIEVARHRHWENVHIGRIRPWPWLVCAERQLFFARREAAQARILLKRYLRKAGLPTDSPLVPQRP